MSTMFKKIISSFKVEKHSEPLVKPKVFRLSQYKSLNTDLMFNSDKEYEVHYLNHGIEEGRSPNVLIISDEIGSSRIKPWLAQPDYTLEEMSVWSFFKDNFSYKRDEPESEFYDLLGLFDDWMIDSKDMALCFLAVYSAIGCLKYAKEGKLPEYFDWVGTEEETDIERFSSWYEKYKMNGESFISIFDGEFYRDTYSDISKLKNVFSHFLFYGDKEGRLMTPFFDSYYYSRSGVDMNLKGLFQKNKFETPIYLASIKKFSKRYYHREDREFVISLTQSLSKVLGGKFKKDGQFSLFLDLINIDYMICNNPEYGTDALEVVVNWVASGCQSTFSPFFTICGAENSCNWLEEYLDWYLVGMPLRTLPTRLFSDEFYISKHLDLKAYPGWSFVHYIRHGQFENRQASPLFDTGWIGHHYDTGGLSAVDYYFQCEAKGGGIKPSPAIMPINKGIVETDPRYLKGGIAAIANDCAEQEIFDLSADSELSRVIKAASKIDPLIKPFMNERMYTLMPFSSDLYAEMRMFSELVGIRDTLIFRDAINFGGADVVLKHCYHAAKQQSDNVAIISTGEVDWDVVDAHGISRDDIIDLSYVEGFSENSMKAHYVYDLIIGSKCKKVYNVNSGALWKAIEDYGKILLLKVKIKAFMFCDDRDEYGNIAGYPANYFISTIRYLDSLFVDSHALKKTLEERSCFSSDIREKIHVVATPLDDVMASTEQYVHTVDNKKVAWAGRFDEQKCPDLLKSIALMLPEITFYVWGKAVLSSKDYGLDKIPNIKLMGLYNDISEITAIKCALYLYTSAWDGVPTVLLRVQEQGLPIIASNVGGVSEAVPEIGLINGFNTEDYAERITYFISNLSDVGCEFDRFKSTHFAHRNTQNFNQLVSFNKGETNEA